MGQQSVYYTYPTKFGTVTLQQSERGITGVYFGSPTLDGRRAPTKLLNSTATQIQEYFAGKRYRFEVELDLDPSPFQCRVWSELSKIPYGETRSASQIAQAIGNKDAFRSVGRAVRENPAVLIIPSHRIEVPAGSTYALADIFRGLQAFERDNI